MIYGRLYSCIVNSVEYLDITNCDQASIIEPLRPITYKLSNSYSNPFNLTTTISYDLLKQSQVALGIYDLLGERKKILVNQSQDAGNKIAMWDGTGDLGAKSL